MEPSSTHSRATHMNMQGLVYPSVANVRKDGRRREAKCELQNRWANFSRSAIIICNLHLLSHVTQACEALGADINIFFDISSRSLACRVDFPLSICPQCNGNEGKSIQFLPYRSGDGDFIHWCAQMIGSNWNVIHATWMLTEAPKALLFWEFRPRNNPSIHVVEFFNNQEQYSNSQL